MTQTPDSPVPPSASPPGPMPTPPAPVDPNTAVQGPAMGLMAVGGLFIFFALVRAVMLIFGLGLGAMSGSMSMFGMGTQGVLGAIPILFNLAFGGVVIYGAMQMKSLRNYNMAMVASIVAMLPCGCCCVVGIPVGIWSLVILLKPEVKAAFTNPTGGTPTA